MVFTKLRTIIANSVRRVWCSTIRLVLWAVTRAKLYISQTHTHQPRYKSLTYKALTHKLLSDMDLHWNLEQNSNLLNLSVSQDEMSMHPYLKWQWVPECMLMSAITDLHLLDPSKKANEPGKTSIELFFSRRVPSYVPIFWIKSTETAKSSKIMWTWEMMMMCATTVATTYLNSPSIDEVPWVRRPCTDCTLSGITIREAEATTGMNAEGWSNKTLKQIIGS